MSTMLPMPPAWSIDLLTVLTALADEARLGIVLALDEQGEMTCSSLAETLGLPDSTLSRHLRILREAGVTQGRRDGTLRWTGLRKKDLDRRFPGLLDSYIPAGKERGSSARDIPLAS